MPAAEGKRGKNKALYKPRDVGNDMGLWVMGDNWLDNAAEALDELEDAGSADPGAKLLKGLGYLLLGEPGAALEEFSGAGAQAAQVKEERLGGFSHLHCDAVTRLHPER